MHTATPANRLRELRERRGFSRVKVAAACEVDTSTVARWEKRSGLIPQQHQATVARLLDVSVPYLTGWAGVEEPFAMPEEAA